MSYYKYIQEKYKLAWRWETSFRTTSAGKDTTNDESDSFFAFPLRLTTFPYIRQMPVKQYIHLPGMGPDYGLIQNQMTPPIEMVFTGNIFHFPFLKALTTAVTNVDATPNTHTYITSTARASTTPSFQLYLEVLNDTADENLVHLFVGCVVKSVNIEARNGELLTASVTILSAREITGTTLTSVPTLPILPLFDTSNSLITFTKATTSYNFTPKSWSIKYNDGKQMSNKTNLYAEEVDVGKREIQVSVLLEPKQKTVISDFLSQSPSTASDIDLTIKVSRDTSTDFISWAFEKIWAVDLKFSWNYMLETELTFILKPTTYESGAKLTLLETNAIASTGGY